MSMLTLAISCVTTSNLPWFMDLTFQVPMKYCSLQHQTLLPSPVPSTTGRCFCFGSDSSFFLKLFLHPSLVAYWAPINLGRSWTEPHTVHGVIKARILKWFAIPFSSGPRLISINILKLICEKDWEYLQNYPRNWQNLRVYLHKW